MHLIAEHGLTRVFPENSLAAFACAMATGFHGIATEVRLSADGELLLYHSRITPDGLPVAALSRTELSRKLGYLVSTLDEGLEALPNAHWVINIATPAAAPGVFALVQQFARTRQMLLVSLRHELIIQAAYSLDIECGLLVTHRPPALNTILYPAMPYPHLRTLIWNYDVLDLPLQQQANALGFHNWAIGAVAEYEHQLCAEFGISGIITQYPEAVGLKPGNALQ